MGWISDIPDRARRFRRRLPAWLTAGLAIALAVNVLLGAAYLWSRGGQTTHVSMEARGTTFNVTVDGHETSASTFEAPPAGAVSIGVDDTTDVPSLPEPRGIDRVTITDLSSGDVLVDDDFSSFPGTHGWTVTRGTPLLEGGVLGTSSPEGLAIRLPDEDLGDVRIDVTYRNITGGHLSARITATGSQVNYDFRPFRHLDGRLYFRDAGQEKASVAHPVLQSDRSELLQSMTAMVLEPYPWLLIVTPIFFLVTFAAGFVPIPDRRGPAFLERAAPWAAVAALTAALFGVTLYLDYSFGSHMPHVPDETSYIFQAKVFASGNLWVDPPPVPESFELGDPPLIIEHDGKWASLYPFGHPLALALGEVFGAFWIVPPLLGAATVMLLFATGRNLYGPGVGLLAALIFAVSPFVLMTASNFMSHNTAAFYLAASLFLVTLRPAAAGRQLAYGALAGACFMMIFSTRQLTGVAFAPAFGVLLATGLVEHDLRAARARQLAGFVAGAAILLLAYFVYRWLTAGDAFAVDPVQGGKDKLGFSGAHSVAAGIANAQTLAAYLVLVLDNAPIATGLVLAALPFIFGTRSRWDWFAAIATLSLMTAYVFYFYHGLMHGPRFWYEAMPLLALLTARGADVAAGVVAAWSRYVHARLGRTHGAPWAPFSLTYGVVIALVVLGGQNWLMGGGRGWFSDYVPAEAGNLKGFNGVDDRTTRRLEDAGIERGLVLVDECPQWWCFGSVVWRNNVSFDGDLVFARNLPDSNPDLFAHYPDRPVYTADYFASALRAFGSTEQIFDPPSATRAPIAGEIPRPTPEPTRTPDLQAARRRDEQRLRDLALVAEMLTRYREAHGAYPTSVNVQSLCVYPNDAGCLLEELGDPVPRDPDPGRQYSYWSRSGSAYVLFAQLEEIAPPASCPPDLPDGVDREGLYCLASS
jgi:4-amino-4-deoxy-L-arabinose transferase-like glycosyltransferase